MAQVLRFMDSFDHYNTSQITSKWTGVLNNVSINAAVGRNGTSALALNTRKAMVRLTTPGGAKQDYVVGAAVNFATLPGFNGPAIFQLSDGGAGLGGVNGAGVQVQLNLDEALNVLKLWRGNKIALLATGSRVFQLNTWYHIEMAVHIHASTGSVTVRVNELTDISFTGNTQRTGNATADEFGLNYDDGGDNNVILYKFDDVYVASGGLTFLGDNRVEAIFPSADGGISDFTPNSGIIHFNRVNEVVSDDDTTYNKSGTVGARDSYVYQDPTPLSATIKGIQFVHRSRTDDEGTRIVGAFYRRDFVNYDSANSFSLTSAYSSPIGDIMETNPATGLPWTLQEIKDAEFGIRIIS